MSFKRKSLFLVFSLLVTATLAACYAPGLQIREEVPNRLAYPVYMLKRYIPTETFELVAYERVREPGGTARIYIEGDGITWLTYNQVAKDPTPPSPLAMHLASHDLSKNVFYLARPCQYTKNPRELCKNEKYWTSGRYSKPIITAMNQAMDNIRDKYNITGFEIIGWAGGGAVATLMAAERHDIINIRTVAGNLDHRETTTVRKTRPYKDSLNPVNIAPKIAHIPQFHFIGKYDEAVPSSAVHSYRDAAGPTSCIRYLIIEDVSHERGWVNRWPDLLEEPLDCNSEQ